MIGQMYVNNQGRKAKVMEKFNKNKRTYYKVQFIKSGYISDVDRSNLVAGRFKDYGFPSVYGVGVSYPGAKKKDLRIYKTWSHMLERCYDPKFISYPSYGGRGVKVCERWLNFKNFEEDIKELPNYEKFLRDRNYSLDKDIRGDGTLYSKETCMFATHKQQSHAQERVKKIKAISKNGEALIFNSKREACKVLGVQNANLYKVLNGERKHTLGYRFEIVS